MKRMYFTKHADSRVIEELFAQCIRRHETLFKRYSTERKFSLFEELLDEKLESELLQFTASAVNAALPYQETQITAEALLAQAAFLRGAVEYGERKRLNILLPEPMAEVMDRQASRQELRGDANFLFALCHYSLGELCAEQEAGQHILLPLSVQSPHEMLHAAIRGIRRVRAEAQGDSRSRLMVVASLLCACAGSLFSRLVTTED